MYFHLEKTPFQTGICAKKSKQSDKKSSLIIYQEYPFTLKL